MSEEAAAPLPSVVLVMGVTGAGKTTIASLLARRLNWPFEDGDDFHSSANIAKMRAGHALDDADRAPWLAAIAARIDEVRARGEHAVIACSALRRSYRDVLIGDRRDVRLVHLEGTAATLRARLEGREGHFMPASLLDTQCATLEPPEADERAIVVSVEASPEQIVGDIIAQLRGGP